MIKYTESTDKSDTHMFVVRVLYQYYRGNKNFEMKNTNQPKRRRRKGGGYVFVKTLAGGNKIYGYLKYLNL